MESLGFKQVTEVGWTLELSNARGKQLNAQQIAKIIKKWHKKIIIPAKINFDITVAALIISFLNIWTKFLKKHQG